ncbi:imidazole glycerol phosphate synthase subunit HisH [Serpentinicella alkaliphila]|uniref:Imidazole glycerol phosphate synthase subunit HisH n=1 Tax=Serpentinicella alkaliphila TaxID=1734049 RepID=A0A4R2TG06_9FIRM|nr:imidazole glycerol phosphate synthase subunit HisH [Serpentinicella alkaliphila]QUH24999.1 imidazole glycerol phosphate synthase subunit HisH [Serpentinicella alkaliphila]TCQ02520.1 imidazole glycerol phosphate synthase subunit HisH [Serpentinicella alkaliphila]
MIAIVNYGMGNLRSVQKAFETVGYDAIVTYEKEDIKNSKAIVIPGVGAFYDAMNNLKNLGLDEVIREEVSTGKPFLGICLGMQILFSYGYEVEKSEGLNVITGDIVKIPEGNKIPHMGWNNLNIKFESSILKGADPQSYFYFVHSYYAKPQSKDVVIATTDYGIEIPAIVQKDNIFGIQFHPEKSSSTGLKILKNFGELI